MEHFFPRIQEEACAQMQIVGRDADEDHTQIIGGDTIKLLGGYISPSPLVSAPLHVGREKGSRDWLCLIESQSVPLVASRWRNVRKSIKTQQLLSNVNGISRGTSNGYRILIIYQGYIESF